MSDKLKCPKCNKIVPIGDTHCECGQETGWGIVIPWQARAEKAESDLAEQKAKCDLCHEAQYVEYAKVKAELDRVREQEQKDITTIMALARELNEGDLYEQTEKRLR